jgi:TolB-like protein/Tfp pilus assembly protein PilF
MASESESDLRLEVGHVLFIDLVGYSKLLIDEQKERLRQLTNIVLATPQVREAANEELVRLATGDGMALVFWNSLEEPAQCTLEMARALREHPEIQVRMGIHSGPVSKVTDLNGHTNIAGPGINLAQRVMDCGDAGHILLSRRVVDDLAQYRQWSERLHDLGECEMKHGLKLALTNLFGDDFGNAAVPAKLTSAIARHKATRKFQIGLAIAATLLLAAGIVFFRFKSSAKSSRIRPAEPPPKSIAVLPFDNLSRDPENAYFSEGIQDEILTRLAKIAELKVISRTSTHRFKSSPDNLPQIAQQLGVANILEGSVQKAGNQVRVNVQLIDAARDVHLWAESFDRDIADIFKVESDISESIANALRARLTGSEKEAITKAPTVSVEAHESYIKGRFFWNKRTGSDLRTAIDYFNQAIEEDPNYALAYAGLADCYSRFSFDVGSLSPKESMPKAKAAAVKAIELDDTLAEAHTSLAFVMMNYDWDWAGAGKEFKRAIELNSNYDVAHHWYSHYLTALGRTQESLVESKRALELDQLGLNINVHLGWHYLYGRQYDLAIEQFRKTLEMDPNYGLTHWYLGLSYEQKAMYPEAAAELGKAKELLKGNMILHGDLGHLYAVSGKRNEAQKILDELQKSSKQQYDWPYQIALIYAGVGEKDRALEWLQKAYEARSDLLIYLRVEPRLDSLHSDPRFEKLANLILPASAK